MSPSATRYHVFSQWYITPHNILSHWVSHYLHLTPVGYQHTPPATWYHTTYTFNQWGINTHLQPLGITLHTPSTSGVSTHTSSHWVSHYLHRQPVGYQHTPPDTLLTPSTSGVSTHTSSNWVSHYIHLQPVGYQHTPPATGYHTFNQWGINTHLQPLDITLKHKKHTVASI